MGLEEEGDEESFDVMGLTGDLLVAVLGRALTGVSSKRLSVLLPASGLP